MRTDSLHHVPLTPQAATAAAKSRCCPAQCTPTLLSDTAANSAVSSRCHTGALPCCTRSSREASAAAAAAPGTSQQVRRWFAEPHRCSGRPALASRQHTQRPLAVAVPADCPHCGCGGPAPVANCQDSQRRLTPPSAAAAVAARQRAQRRLTSPTAAAAGPGRATAGRRQSRHSAVPCRSAAGRQRRPAAATGPAVAAAAGGSHPAGGSRPVRSGAALRSAHLRLETMALLSSLSATWHSSELSPAPCQHFD